MQTRVGQKSSLRQRHQAARFLPLLLCLLLALLQLEMADEICRAFRNTGHCRYGEECKFIHSEGEPIAPPNKPVGMVRSDPIASNCAAPKSRARVCCGA